MKALTIRVNYVGENPTLLTKENKMINKYLKGCDTKSVGGKI